MKNRWVVLAAGVTLQLVLGGIYAWSTFVPYLMEGYDLSRSRCGLIFGLVIFSFTVAMIPAGAVLQRMGPRITVSIGAALFAAGYLIASFSQGDYAVLLFGIGVVAGAGIGFGYVCPLAVGMRWFPENKGLVTGVSVAGFGGGAILLSAIAEHYLIHGVDVLVVFRWIGIIASGVIVAVALLMAEPPGNRQSFPAGTSGIVGHLLTPMFMICAAGMFAGTFAGLLVVGNLAPMALNMGFSEEQAVLFISVFAVGNGSGRIIWGQIHDRIEHVVIPVSLLFLGASLFPLILAPPFWLMTAACVMVGFGFGACFVIYAASVVHYFGDELFPRLYPLCFLGYGLAGLIAPAVGGWIADRTGSYREAVLLSVAVVALAGIVSLLRSRIGAAAGGGAK